MIREELFTGVDSFVNRLRSLLQRVNDASDGWLVLLFSALREVLSFRSSLVAAGIAYFTLFSVFPIVLLTVAIATVWLDLDPYLSGNGAAEVLQRLEYVVPALSNLDLLRANLEQIDTARGAITRISTLTLIWSASSVFYVLTRAMDDIWQDETERAAWRHRALAIIVTLTAIAALWIVSIAWGVVLPIADRVLPHGLLSLPPFFSNLVTALVSIFIFAILYYLLPHVRLKLNDVLIGAVFAGALWELAKRGFVFFVSNYLTLSNLLYGSVTAIIAFLTWVYISSLIFLFGAHVNERYMRKRRAQQQAAQQR